MNMTPEEVTLVSVEPGRTDRGNAFIATFSPTPDAIWRRGFEECTKDDSEIEDFYWDDDGRLIFPLVMPTLGPDLLRMAMYPKVEDTNEWVIQEINRPKINMHEMLPDGTTRPGLDG